MDLIQNSAKVNDLPLIATDKYCGIAGRSYRQFKPVMINFCICIKGNIGVSLALLLLVVFEKSIHFYTAFR